MTKRLQIYYSTLLGAIGGVLGWWLMGSFDTQSWNVLLSNPFVGAGLGLCIGGCVAASDGAMIKGVASRALRDGLIGAFGGALAGLLGLLIGGIAFLGFEGGFIGRGIGWLLLGVLIGASDLLVSRSPRRALYGAIGGLMGGLVGGLLYEGLTQLFLQQSGSAQVVVGGLGLAIVGAMIGAFIPLTRQILAGGELHVQSGAQAGLVREVTDSATIGRYDGNDLYLPDGGIDWRHARIQRGNTGFELSVLPEAKQPAWIGNLAIAPGTSHALKHGDQIQIGEALLLFNERRV
jgi:hypothetical protein